MGEVAAHALAPAIDSRTSRAVQGRERFQDIAIRHIGVTRELYRIGVPAACPRTASQRLIEQFERYNEVHSRAAHDATSEVVQNFHRLGLKIVVGFETGDSRTVYLQSSVGEALIGRLHYVLCLCAVNAVEHSLDRRIVIGF